jgi:hypothetical protein
LWKGEIGEPVVERLRASKGNEDILRCRIARDEAEGFVFGKEARRSCLKLAEVVVRLREGPDRVIDEGLILIVGGEDERSGFLRESEVEILGIGE